VVRRLRGLLHSACPAFSAVMRLLDVDGHACSTCIACNKEVPSM
jgi:hypothetical protein